ncbi:hypothetical protein RFI_38249, partial [Reticulomyxa filosa]
SVEDNGLCADVGLCKNSKSQFVLIVARYVGNVELLQLYVSLGAKFSIRANMFIRQWCAYHRQCTNRFIIILQMIFDIAMLCSFFYNIFFFLKYKQTKNKMDRLYDM